MKINGNKDRLKNNPRENIKPEKEINKPFFSFNPLIKRKKLHKKNKGNKTSERGVKRVSPGMKIANKTDLKAVLKLKSFLAI